MADCGLSGGGSLGGGSAGSADAVLDITADSDEDIAEVVDVIGDSDDELAFGAARGAAAPPLRFRGYRRGRELGRGASGKVFVCTRKEGNAGFAVKAVDLRRMQMSSNAEREHTALCREVEILKTLPPHPNIVQMIDAFEEGGWFLMILELVGGGDLYTVLTAREQPRLEEREAAFVMRQLANGLTFLHGQGVIHRDLKLENVLIASEIRERALVLYTVKITDFGLSKAIGGGVSEAYSLVGTRPYTAPEVLSGASYDFSSDLWGLGVVLYILLVGRFPFNDVPEKQEELDAIVSAVASASEGGRALVSGMLQLDPAKRTTLEKLGGHEWLQDEIDRPHEPLLKRLRTGSPPREPPPERGTGEPAAAPPPQAELKAGEAPADSMPPPTPEALVDELFAASPLASVFDAASPLAFASPTPAPPESPADAGLASPGGPLGLGELAAPSYEASEVLPPMKKPDVMQVHMMVPDKFSDIIHSKAGPQLKQVASTLGCQVRTSPKDSATGHRLIIIGNYNQCSIVQELVRSRLADAFRHEGEELPDTADVILFVRAEAAGVVTGKRQYKLKQIRNQSGAKIYLRNETVKRQRPCVLSGAFQNVLRAQRHVFDLVRAVPVAAPTEKGPDLPRTRISPEPLLGRVVSWKGYVGWIQAAEEVDHPQAGEHHGHIYLHQKDVLEGGPLKPGQQVRFHVYSDFLGLGAEECHVV